jgi:photosystem II stability/assembly factor-like uncharacterized protein
MRPTKISLFLVTTAAALAVAAPAPAAVQSSHSGWRWGNPLPQGTQLGTLDFSGSRGYAAGQFGTLLRTDDGGATWRGLATGLTEPLDVVRVLSPDSFVVAGRCALRRSDDGGATFRRLPWTASDASCTGGITSVAFPSSTTGFLLLGNGNVLRSTDSGKTWSRRTAVPGTAATSAYSGVTPTDLTFTSADRGFASTAAGSVFSTVDGGNTWTPVVDEPFAIRSLTFATPQIGYAVGDAPFALATTDGGVSWTEQPLPADSGGLASVRCATTALCLAVSTNGDRLVRTADGGTTWRALTVATTTLRAAAFASPTRAVAVGDGGTTVASDDGGVTFSPLGGALPGSFTGLKAASAKVAYAYGAGGSLARTTDGGTTWEEIDAATSDTVADVAYVSLTTGFVLDEAGQLLRTDNAGDSWQILNAGTGQRPQALVAPRASTVVLAGPVGIRRSTDGGQTFKAVPDRDVRETPLFAIDHAGRAILASGPKALRLSRDDGATWVAMKRPTPTTRVNDADLVSARTAYVLDTEGALWRTDDAGRHWHALPALGSELGYAVRFADARHGWVAMAELGSDEAGYVLRTADGGRTWQPQLVAATPLALDGLAAPRGSAGFALTRANALFSTTTSGAAGSASTLRISTPTPRVRSGGVVRIDGRLARARGGERIVVSLRERGSTRWLYQEVAAASNGTFTVVTRITNPAVFVAQWAGDERKQGAGTPILRVDATPKPKR